jgi:glyoxylase-like metal-dependent hydrolase (beta-lactamase superfamily II)
MSADAATTIITTHTNGVSNWFIAASGDKLTLVDAGVPGDWSRLLVALASRGLKLGAIDCILLTHAHSDHTGFAERARSEANATARVHGADLAVATGAAAPGKHETGLARYLVHVEAYRTLIGLMRGGATRIVPLVSAVAIDDGEVVDVPGKPRVVHLPGHTPGSCALWFEDAQSVCTGDALVTRNPLTGRHGPQIMPSGLNVDSALAMQSLARLRETNARTVLPGHGDAWAHGVESAVDLARRAGLS